MVKTITSWYVEVHVGERIYANQQQTFISEFEADELEILSDKNVYLLHGERRVDTEITDRYLPIMEDYIDHVVVAVFI